MRPSFGFGSTLTPLGKRLLIIYGTIYILELIFTHWIKTPLVTDLQLFPITSDGFHVWQIATHPFVHNPAAPIGFIINCIMIYFFAAPIEYVMGPRRFLTLFYLSAAGAVVCGLAFSSVAGLNAPFMGMMPSLLSLIVVFGLLNPEATILLMFILPVKAKYLSYGTILITGLTFLAKVNPFGAYHLGGILLGYIYLRNPRTLFDPQLLHFKYLQWQLKRKRANFRVIDGDKDDNDRPTYH